MVTNKVGGLDLIIGVVVYNVELLIWILIIISIERLWQQFLPRDFYVIVIIIVFTIL